MNTKAPNVFTVTAAQNILDGRIRHVVETADGVPLRYLRVTPSQAPDPGTPHVYGFNDPVNEASVTTGNAYEIDLTHLPERLAVNYAVSAVWLTAGKDGTTFTIEGHV